MKVVLIYFNDLSNNGKASLSYASYCLVNKIFKEGLLERVICLSCDKDIGIPKEKISAVKDNFLLKVLFKILHLLERNIRIVHTRVIRERIFDLYAAHIIASCGNVHLFCARPLFLHVINKAKSLRNKVWVQVLAPHPLLHYGLVRNEEIRYGVKSRGTTTNIRRMVRLTQAINESDHVFTLSPEIARFTYQSYVSFVERHKLLRLKHYVGIDKNAFTPRKNRRDQKEGDLNLIFLCVAFMNLTKGIPYLLEAWKLLLERHSVPGKLVLAGQIDGNFDQIIKKHYLQVPNVEYVGYVKEVGDQYRQADVFVSPSVADAGPTTIMEAMASGLPIIASRNCGFATLITQGKDGFTYDYNDVEELSNIMYWFFKNPDQIKKMGDSARSVIGDFSIDKYADELVSAFKGET